MILDTLKFVAGSLGKKEYVTGLTHFTIDNNTIRANNGIISICSPIEFDITCSPKGESLIKAIEKCEDSIKLMLTPTGRLSVKSGAFKALVECVPEPAPQVEPEGEFVPINGEVFIKGAKAMLPFIGDDAETDRVWSNGLLIKDKSLFATNNVILVQYWLGMDLPFAINIPRQTIKELIRIGQYPIGLQMDKNSVTFHFEGDRWLRTQLYGTEWPDIAKLLNKDSNQQPIDERIFKGLEAVKPFVDKIGSVYFSPGFITTQPPGTDIGGAEYFIPDLQTDGRFTLQHVALLEGVAKTIDWDQYPAPCVWQSDLMRGVIVGVRK